MDMQSQSTAGVVSAAVPRPAAILFDLDGTLIDSAADLGGAVNEVLAVHGLGPLSVAAVRAMIGHGIRKLVERAFLSCGCSLSLEELDTATDRMNAAYERQLVHRTILLPGAAGAVLAAKTLGIPLGLVTNKPERFAREILRHFGLLARFEAIVGGDSGPRRKPEPDMLLHAASQLGVVVSDCLMVGDGEADLAAAQAAAMPSLLISGGYGHVDIDHEPTYRLEGLDHFPIWLLATVPGR